MITVLQRDLGVRYNLAFSESPYDGTDSRNLFIHGLLSGHGGTCVTMPVLYAAIGRRLGYPMKLAFAVEHVFCRWDDGRGERFDMEATSQGFRVLRGDRFSSSPKPAPAEGVERGWLPKSLRSDRKITSVFWPPSPCPLPQGERGSRMKLFFGRSLRRARN
jgi:Transglutaminase-like superfamily